MPAAMFNIIEPIIFGLPIAMNSYLMIPFVIAGTLGCAIPYILTLLGFIGRTFVDVPFATPAFISGILSTGDWKVLIVQVLVFVIGLGIYFPFFKMYEKNEIAKENEMETVVE
ncbi:Lichenan permease IIC component [compost metagenome]